MTLTHLQDIWQDSLLTRLYYVWPLTLLNTLKVKVLIDKQR